MAKNWIAWTLTGGLLTAIGLVSAAGCSSARGECENACSRGCDVLERCEDYVPGDFDVDQCLDDCAESCDDYIDDKENECDNGIETDGNALDDCHESLDELENACVDNNDGKVLQNLGEVGDNCKIEDFYNCK